MKIDRRLATAAATLALLSLGVFVRGQLPSANDLVFAPFEYGGDAQLIGKVDNVRATVADEVNGVPTHAAWVVVDFDYTPDSLISLQGEIEAADGTLYASENEMLLSCGTRYTGLRTQCTLVFEMPAEQLDGARLVIGPPATQMAPQAIVPVAGAAVLPKVTREEVTL
ncbi:hypothetical protein M5J20_06725 [Corynebacterium sp. TA-R-1]|uniref:Secreted protein n=1 Tax=Corynebacterium stercoris TaxID=2943490 RepID=A0ABT1G1I1_9CORY|nr:hypothetical protein [Corynebacterium stercoris]MCP1387884.1 hypothetical protein [Corynebacterium stercoris]